mgnify:CR=1 FL=1
MYAVKRHIKRNDMDVFLSGKFGRQIAGAVADDLIGHKKSPVINDI